MAKLYLIYEKSTLKEYAASQGGVVTIGRLPDNLIQIDNPAVSSHHARIYFQNDQYVIEDLNSLNGTLVNKERVTKVALNDGDEITVGKHTVQFKDEWHEEAATPPTVETRLPELPKMDATMVLDTKKAKEMMAAAAQAQAQAQAQGGAAPVKAAPPARERTGILTVLDGKTDQPQYLLGSKLTVIGKSDMASIKLKGWFAPNVAATINKRDGKYFIAASERKIKLKVNAEPVLGQRELTEGDTVEVEGVKMSFDYTS